MSLGACPSCLCSTEATVELSQEKRVSGSKVIPLLKMVEQMLQEEAMTTSVPLARELGEHLSRLLREKLHSLQSMGIMSLATLLDPPYETIGFFSSTRANEALKSLTYECANITRATQSQRPPAAVSLSQDGETPGNYVCALFKQQLESMMTLTYLIC